MIAGSLVDHREHSVAGQTSFRAIGPVAHGGEARLDHVRAADVDHPCAVGLACGSVRVVACAPNQRAIGRLNLPIAAARERRLRVYCVEKLGIEITVLSPESSMRLSFAALDLSERVVLVPSRSSES